ncbi:hypothetical protein D3C86_1956680 [compost metagenome]
MPRKVPSKPRNTPVLSLVMVTLLIWIKVRSIFCVYAMTILFLVASVLFWV